MIAVSHHPILTSRDCALINKHATTCYPRFRMSNIVKSQVMELKKLWSNKRMLMFQALNLAMIVFSALMIWKVM